METDVRESAPDCLGRADRGGLLPRRRPVQVSDPRGRVAQRGGVPEAVLLGTFDAAAAPSRDAWPRAPAHTRPRLGRRVAAAAASQVQPKGREEAQGDKAPVGQQPLPPLSKPRPARLGDAGGRQGGVHGRGGGALEGDERRGQGAVCDHGGQGCGVDEVHRR